MYCENCGKKLKENADICLNCGIVVKKEIKANKPKIPGKGLGIASMVVGIVAAYNSLIPVLVSLLTLISDNIYSEEKIVIGIISLFWPMVLALTGLGLSIGAKSKNNLKMTNAGLILSIISIAFCILSLIGIIFS